MKLVQKIVVIVIIQIMLIISSFAILIYSESQLNLTGNAVNIAGKNRLLTALVQIDLNHILFHNATYSDKVTTDLADLKINIYFLKSGGLLNDIEIIPLSSQFGNDWSNVAREFEIYEDTILLLLSQDGATPHNIEKSEEASFKLIESSNVLTEKLGKNVEQLSIQMVQLQALLGLINVASHIFTIAYIWRILNRDTADQIKTEKLVAIGELAAMLAHDMRNPLGTIRNCFTLIQNKVDSTLINEESNMIRRSIKRMSHQIEGVLTYARNVPYVLEPHSIHHILEQSIATIEVPKNIKIDISNDDITVNCDEEKIEFVFTNIILNAIQAIQKNTGHITIKLYEVKDVVMITFENSGPNIAKKDMDQIFEPLFTTKMEGTGLGLTSCKNIIQAHHGKITVRNKPVTFTIHIPIHNSGNNVR